MILIWLTDKTSHATVGYALLSVYKLNILRPVTSTTLPHSQLQICNYLCRWTKDESPSITQSTSYSISSIECNQSRGTTVPHPGRCKALLSVFQYSLLRKQSCLVRLLLVVKYLRNVSVRRNSSGYSSVSSHDRNVA